MRKFFRNIFLLLFLLGAGKFLVAQDNTFLQGKVFDSSTGEPIVFATVRIQGKSRGVITNMDGGFRLPLILRDNSESIEVSSMGYQEKVFKLQKLSPTDINTIYLAPGVISLKEAIVSARKKREPSARRIVRRAIEYIPNNYHNNNHSLIGYYRDYQLDSVGYVNLNEALLEVFDRGFDEIDTVTTKTRMYEYRRNLNFRRDTLADAPYNYQDWRKIIDNAYLSAYGGNEFALLRVHDAIRNYKINSFDFINNMKAGDVLKNHSFKRLSDTYTEREPLYTIQLKKVFPDYSVRGKMFVAKTDYAIQKLEYAVYDDRKRNKDSTLQNKGIKGELIFEVTTEYRRGRNDKMNLSYISFHNSFQLAKPPIFIMDYVMILAEEGAFALIFNNKLSSEQDELKSKWFDFKFKGEKIKFREIKRENDTIVKLYPNMDKKALDRMMRELLTMNRKRLDMVPVLKFSVSDLEDEHGNVLNTWSYTDYNQFREFFVQQTDLISALPKDGHYMDMRRPIFKDQPISRPENVLDYWMNTPLQNINK